MDSHEHRFEGRPGQRLCQLLTGQCCEIGIQVAVGGGVAGRTSSPRTCGAKSRSRSSTVVRPVTIPGRARP